MENPDGITIKPGEFYSRLKDAKTMPTTSQPSPGDMRKTFSRLLEQGYEIFGIFISEKVSGTLASAIQARDNLTLPETRFPFLIARIFPWRLAFKIDCNARRFDGASLTDCQKLAKQVRPIPRFPLWRPLSSFMAGDASEARSGCSVRRST